MLCTTTSRAPSSRPADDKRYAEAAGPDPDPAASPSRPVPASRVVLVCSRFVCARIAKKSAGALAIREHCRPTWRSAHTVRPQTGTTPAASSRPADRTAICPGRGPVIPRPGRRLATAAPSPRAVRTGPAPRPVRRSARPVRTTPRGRCRWTAGRDRDGARRRTRRQHRPPGRTGGIAEQPAVAIEDRHVALRPRQTGIEHPQLRSRDSYGLNDRRSVRPTASRT